MFNMQELFVGIKQWLKPNREKKRTLIVLADVDS